MAKKNNISFKNNSKTNNETTVVIKDLIVRPIKRGTQSIDSWRNAIKSAEGHNKNRLRLMELYSDILLDSNVDSGIDKRIKAVTNLQLKFVDEQGKEVEELTKLANKPYFEELLKEIMNSRFYGYSLLIPEWSTDLTNIDSKTTLIDRRHVKPEFGIVVKQPGDNIGVNYNEEPQVNFVVRAGDNSDLGKLMSTAQYAIYKRGGFGDYAEFAEVFGMPFRHATYTDETDKPIIDKALEEAGAAGYMTTPDGVVVKQDYVNVQGGGNLHDGLRKACNEEINISLLGQTETTAASSSSGYAQSKTHADVLAEFHKDDRKFTLRVLNEELNRVLRSIGFNAVGSWMFIDEINEPLQEKFERDTQFAKDRPVDDDYFYKTYGIPKPENYDKLKKEQAEKAKQEQETATTPTNKKEELAEFQEFLKLKEGKTFFDKFKRLFFFR